MEAALKVFVAVFNNIIILSGHSTHKPFLHLIGKTVETVELSLKKGSIVMQIAFE